eukprot:4582275-Prymnesium_polylepis.1
MLRQRVSERTHSGCVCRRAARARTARSPCELEIDLLAGRELVDRAVARAWLLCDRRVERAVYQQRD